MPAHDSPPPPAPFLSGAADGFAGAVEDEGLPTPTPTTTGAQGAAPAHAAQRDGSAARPSRRCGWVDNPTPANWWLVDRDGEWTIGVQGGYQADGDMPDFGSRWVETNGHHGYGCACMVATVDAATKPTHPDPHHHRPKEQAPAHAAHRDGSAALSAVAAGCGCR